MTISPRLQTSSAAAINVATSTGVVTRGGVPYQRSEDSSMAPCSGGLPSLSRRVPSRLSESWRASMSTAPRRQPKHVERVDSLLALVSQEAEDVYIGDSPRWVQWYGLARLWVPGGRSLGDVEADPRVVPLFPRLDVGRALDFDRPAARHFNIERTPLFSRFPGQPQCTGHQELGQYTALNIAQKIGSGPSPVVPKPGSQRFAPRIERLAA